MGVIENTIDNIKQMLVDGELRPGDKLPIERDLAVRLGVSRNTLREAIRALTTIRVLHARQGDGTYVTTCSRPATRSGPGCTPSPTSSAWRTGCARRCDGAVTPARRPTAIS